MIAAIVEGRMTSVMTYSLCGQIGPEDLVLLISTDQSSSWAENRKLPVHVVVSGINPAPLTIRACAHCRGWLQLGRHQFFNQTKCHPGFKPVQMFAAAAGCRCGTLDGAPLIGVPYNTEQHPQQLGLSALHKREILLVEQSVALEPTFTHFLFFSRVHVFQEFLLTDQKFGLTFSHEFLFSFRNCMVTIDGARGDARLVRLYLLKQRVAENLQLKVPPPILDIVFGFLGPEGWRKQKDSPILMCV